MFNFKDYSIKLKLIIIFIVFKVLPLIFLAAIGVSSFLEIDELLKESSQNIILQSQSSIEKTTNTAIMDSIVALDKKSQAILEDKSVIIANQIATFLKHRDQDILFLSKLNIDEKLLRHFYEEQIRDVYVPAQYSYNQLQDRWVTDTQTAVKTSSITAKIKDNAKEFHKVIHPESYKQAIPIYKEISFYAPDGKEIYKVSALDETLKDISDKESTYLHAEHYFKEAKKLREGEIYVSNVIGAYVPSPIIGTVTKQSAEQKGVAFEPQKYAYAGRENPVGKKFEAIIRFVTPVYKNHELQGYLTLALDHHHIMDFTDFSDPISSNVLHIPDASNGNYAFMWSHEFECISHPRDYFIVGYDAKTGEKVPGWIDSELAQKFKKSGEKDLNAFLHKQPLFFEQSLKKKPNLQQLRDGQIGLDCKYLNFAPQCQGWSQLVSDGGYGSFVIYWSHVWKLTTAAAIPYYTGQYGASDIGFGFVTIGANVSEFHSATTQTKKEIDKVFEKENNNIKKQISLISNNIYESIKNQISKMLGITFLLIILVIYVAVLVANYLSRRLNKIIVGTQKLKDQNFDYQIEEDSHDELGKLTTSFNEMAHSINELKLDLEQKLFTDDLTGLGNRRAFYRDLKKSKEGTLFLVDIDSFKNINDHYGSDAGSFVLKEFAQVLHHFVSNFDMQLYRMGSDEFILLKPIVCDTPRVDEVVTQLQKLVAVTHFKSEDLHIETTISFACGVSRGDVNLVEHADLALNEAKHKKLLYLLYDAKNPSMNRHTEYVLWREKIEYAIENDNIIPYFQPIIDMKNPNNRKYEALIRMRDNDNIIAPYMFLDIARESKLYPKLTKIMIEKSFKMFDEMDATFSINISIEDIEEASTIAFIRQSLKRYNVSHKLIFELLESQEIENFDKILPFIQEMKALGVRFAIDDFGSGYSNFAYMLQMKPDFIKIDGSLIKEVSQDSNSYHVVGAIVKFAKALEIEVVAEYVSTKEILDTLNSFDIDYMQGYYFSEPQEQIK
jgi:diguanylate cyclase (GGDEF)-like protein